MDEMGGLLIVGKIPLYQQQVPLKQSLVNSPHKLNITKCEKHSS